MAEADCAADDWAAGRSHSSAAAARDAVGEVCYTDSAVHSWGEAGRKNADLAVVGEGHYMRGVGEHWTRGREGACHSERIVEADDSEQTAEVGDSIGVVGEREEVFDRNSTVLTLASIRSFARPGDGQFRGSGHGPRQNYLFRLSVSSVIFESAIESSSHASGVCTHAGSASGL